jgi:hypothetical protein
MGFRGRSYEGAYTSNVRKVGIKDYWARCMLEIGACAPPGLDTVDQGWPGIFGRADKASGEVGLYVSRLNAGFSP